MTLINKILAIIICIVFIGSTLGGYFYGKSRVKVLDPIVNTVILHDTITHNIVDSFPYYVNHHDTVIYNHNIPTIVDTVKILKDYFAVHVFDRKWEDDTLKVNVIDSISKNTPIGNIFKYKIKAPFTTTTTTIDNSITYNRYVNIELTIPVKDAGYTEFGIMYNFEKGGFGVGYLPKLQSFEIKGEMNLFKFKKKK
jgi:hypothetical protein